MASIETLFLTSLILGFVSVHAGIIKDSDLGEPLTPEDFEYAESEEYQNIIANEETHGENENENPELFEGDIEMSEEQRKVLLERGMSGIRQVVNLKWPKGVDGKVRIPYKVPKGLSQKRRGDIRKAVMEYEKETCIRFVEYKGEKTHYINIITDTKECRSPVGMMVFRNNVHFGPGCTWGSLCHELMHSLGFHHEHTRTNRDKYVEIVWENIRKDKVHNFRKCERKGCYDLGDQYDYGSIMHYPMDAFASAYPKITIKPKQAGVTIGQRQRLSPLDVKGINDFYEC